MKEIKEFNETMTDLKMKASIVIPTFNKLPRLKLVMASLGHQSILKDMFEVIVVDDGSREDTIEYLKSLKPVFNYKYLLTQNSGRSAARNVGASIAQNDILIFIDDDVILHPNFVYEHLSSQNNYLRIIHGKIFNLTYLKFFEDPIKGVLYSHLLENIALNDLKKRCISEEDIFNKFEELEKSNTKLTSLEKAIKTILSTHPSKIPWIGCTGGNFSVPKVWFDKVGGFDEGFGKRWGGEDFELGYRLFMDGYLFDYSDRAVNYHIAHYRQDFKEDLVISFKHFYNVHKDKNIVLVMKYLLGDINLEALISQSETNYDIAKENVDESEKSMV